MADSQTLAARLKDRLGDNLLGCHTELAEVTLEIAPEKLLSVCEVLKNDAEFAFEILIDCCGVDYSAYGLTEWETDSTTDSGFSRGVTEFALADNIANSKDPSLSRFAVVYHLLSITNNHRLRVRCHPESNDFPVIDSVYSIWNGVNWFEREAFDLFGIVFDGHPDMRRILSDYGFIGHPFRKDYPLSGHVEMRYDADKGRVIYQPVSIEPRVLVPRVIRHDHRYEDDHPDEESSNA